MKKVITIGGATQDIFIMHKPVQMLHLCLKEGKRSFLIYESGRKVEVQGLDYHTGGGATNTAASFKNLEFDVAACFKVGHDHEAEFILNDLRERLIDTSFVVYGDHSRTATSCILPTEHGDRIPLVYRGATTQLEEKDIPQQAFASTDCVHVSSLNGPAASLLLPITTSAKRAGCFVSVNPGTYQFRKGAQMLCQSLPTIDVLILNAHEAHLCLMSIAKENAELYAAIHKDADQSENKELPQLLRSPMMPSGGCFNIKVFFRHILKHGPKIVVVTNGKEGVYVAYEDKILFHPTIVADVVSTLGAGDAFASTFVGWLLHDHLAEDALRAGIINCASVIEKIGTKTGLLLYEEIKKRMATLDKKMMRTFDL